MARSLQPLPPLRVTPQQWLEAIAVLREPPVFATMGYQVVLPGWAFTHRRVPEQLLFFVAEHEAQVQAEGRSFGLGPGDLLWLAPGTMHTVRNSDPSRPILLYYMRPRIRVRGRDLRLGEPLVHLTDAWELRPWLDQLFDDVTTDLPHRGPRIIAGLVLLFSGIFRLAARTPAQGPMLTHSQRQALYRRVHSHDQGRLTPRDLARAVELSPDYFARVFHRTFHTSPRRWLLEQRIQRAAARLDETTLQVTQIAQELGYCDVFLFSRQFKQITGRSPQAYRRRGGGEAG